MNTPTSTGRTGEPRLASIASWAVLIASFALSASTWIAMAVLAGFTDTATLPLTDITVRVAWLMPVAVDGYVVVALVLWMSPVPANVAAFARKNTYGAAGIGIVAQSAYHLLSTMSATDQTWRVALAAIVGALPPAVAALAVHMRALIRREISTTGTTTPTDPTTTVPAHTVPAPDPAVPAALPAAVTPDTTPPIDPEPVPVSASTPEPARIVVPTPAAVATRITKTTSTSTPERSDAEPRSAARPSPRPRTTGNPPADQQAAPATDTPVTGPDAAPPTLPTVPPELLDRATTVARQYRTEHGYPITPGQLAVRLKVTSEQAAQALTAIDLDRNRSTDLVSTVNGNRPTKATR